MGIPCGKFSAAPKNPDEDSKPCPSQNWRTLFLGAWTIDTARRDSIPRLILNPVLPLSGEAPRRSAKVDTAFAFRARMPNLWKGIRSLTSWTVGSTLPQEEKSRKHARNMIRLCNSDLQGIHQKSTSSLYGDFPEAELKKKRSMHTERLTDCPGG